MIRRGRELEERMKRDHPEAYAVHGAIVDGDTARLVQLLGTSSDPKALANDAGGGPGAPLHQAASSEDPITICVLFGHGADLEAIWHPELLHGPPRPITPLELAIELGHPANAEMLIRLGAEIYGSSLNGGGEGVPPLNRAAKHGMASVARALLKRGAAPDTASPGSAMTPLHYAAANGEQDVAKILIDAGADREARDRRGWTPLLTAAEQCKKEMYDFLAGEGCDEGAVGRYDTRTAREVMNGDASESPHASEEQQQDE